MGNPIICVVDAFSTGAELASQFAKYGYHAVHVRSSKDIDHDLASTFRPSSFKAEITLQDNWDEVLNYVIRWNPKYVIAGTETGVILADRLASTLGLIGNAPTTSSLRRSKYEMNEALRKKDIPSVMQHCCSNTEEALKWAEENNFWPIVAKPLDSAGTDDVYFCRTPGELHDASQRILHHRNRMGSYNDRFLVQECLKGQQYFVNAVSMDGKHRFTEIWKDTKKEVDGASMICDREDLLPFFGKEQKQIFDYMKLVLDCLGIREGASHSEIMLTDKGPILIESAARMQGTILHDALIESIGESHVTTTVERYVNPEAFKKMVDKGYTLSRSLACVTLASNVSGVVLENNIKEKLAHLPSFYAVFHTPEPGDIIHRTVDLFTNPGIIYLLHENIAQIDQDYMLIRMWEDEGLLFKVAPMSATVQD